MRFVTNESIPGVVVRRHRSAGFDVLSMKETMRGQDDRSILARAQTEGRIVVTQGKDFGELAFRYGLPADSGIILFRLSGSDPDTDAGRMLDVLTSRHDWVGHFSVASDDRVRMMPLSRISRETE